MSFCRLLWRLTRPRLKLPFSTDEVSPTDFKSIFNLVEQLLEVLPLNAWRSAPARGSSFPVPSSQFVQFPPPLLIGSTPKLGVELEFTRRRERLGKRRTITKAHGGGAQRAFDEHQVPDTVLDWHHARRRLEPIWRGNSNKLILCPFITP